MHEQAEMGGTVKSAFFSYKINEMKQLMRTALYLTNQIYYITYVTSQ